MKSLYKYPQGEFPYRDLIETNRRAVARGDGIRALDTGAFDEDRYFDVSSSTPRKVPTTS